MCISERLTDRVFGYGEFLSRGSLQGSSISSWTYVNLLKISGLENLCYYLTEIGVYLFIAIIHQIFNTMRKLLCLTLVLGLSLGASAKIWRVNNNAGGVSADAATIQAGHDMASAGDTLHIEASAADYGSLTCVKPLVIIGPGYFLGSNPETQANLLSGKIHSISFQTAGNGSMLMGCEVLYSMTIYTSNIVIMRNKLRIITIGSGAATYANIIIKQNYFQFDGYWDGAFLAVSSGTVVSNLIIKNNFVLQYSGNYGICNLGSTVSGVFENNVIKNSNVVGGVTLNNFTVKNNIFYDGTFTGVNCMVYNNIGSGTQFPAGNGNQQNVDMTTVFVLTGTASTDGQWALKPGSPAIGAGEMGVDCGMYGGSDPYVLSGMPAVPAIYYFNTSGNNTQQYIRVKVKSHK